MPEVARTVRSARSSARFGWIAGGAALLTATLFLRVLSYPVMTSDYIYFVSKWIETLAAHPGLTAFAEPFANYAPLYLYLLKGLAFVPVWSLISVKTLSLAFDIAIAAAACLILYTLGGRRMSAARQFFNFSVMVSIPSALINSSLWGQSDALYGAGIMTSAFFMLANIPAAAALAFGFAFSMKVQAMFFLPVLAGYLMARQQLRQLVWVPAVFIASVIPALLAGGWYWLFIYMRQVEEYTDLTINAPTMFAFFEGLPEYADVLLFFAGLVLAAAAALVAGIMAAHATAARSSKLFLLACLLSTLSIVFFLPRMHERYFYLADLFAVLYALYTPRRWYVAVLVVGASLLSYMPYLADSVPDFGVFVVDLRIPAAAMAVALAAVLLDIVRLRRITKTPDAAPYRSGV